MTQKKHADKKKKRSWAYYKESFQLYRHFLKFLKPYWKVGAIAGLLMIISALLQLPSPLLTKYLIDKIVPLKNLEMLNLFTLVLVGVVLLDNGIDYLRSFLLIKYRYLVEKDIRSTLFNKVLYAQLSFIEKEKVGYMASRIDNDVEAIRNLFMDTLLNLAVNMLTFIVGVGLCFYLNTRLAIVSLVSLPLFIISFHVCSRRMNRLTAERQEQWARLRGTTVEYISQVKVIKSFFKIKEFFQFYISFLDTAISSSRKQEVFNVISNIAIGITGVLLPLFVLWYGVREIIMGNFTLGGFIAFNTCISYLYNPVQSFVSLNIDIHSALAAAKRIAEIFRLNDETTLFGSKRIQTLQSIELKHVSYYYDEKEKRGIKNISFSIKRGEKLVIVGETGKGKTTIARLILGFDVPAKGELLVNGIDYKNYDLGDLRQRIAFVPQEPELFSGRIIDNIAFFSKQIENELLENVMTWCALDETLKRFPEGINTAVFEAGTGISGGEKQRIAIARAIVGKPDFLILDEVTSAIDPETESAMMEYILALPWNPGVIMITHRYHYLDQFDKVINLASENMEG